MIVFNLVLTLVFKVSAVSMKTMDLLYSVKDVQYGNMVHVLAFIKPPTPQTSTYATNVILDL